MPAHDPVWREGPNGVLTFEPSADTQRDFIDSPAHEILFSGMYGNGKSVAMCIKAWKLCERYPGMRGAAVRRHYEALKLSTVRLLARIMGPALWRSGAQGGKEPSAFNFANGSSIDFLGISGDNERTKKLLSTDYGFILADEINELSESEWDLAMGRLRQSTVPIRQGFGSCNPGPPTHWLYKRFGVAQGPNRQFREDPCPRCQRIAQRDGSTANLGLACRTCGGTGKIQRLSRELFMAGAHDNDANHPAEYVEWRNNLTGTQAARYRDGKWVAFEGCVFEDYDPTLHCCDRPESWEQWGGYPPPDWQRVVGIDFGYYPDPFACEWFAISPDQHWYRYRELYMTRRTIDKHAAKIMACDADELETLRRHAKELKRETELDPYLQELHIVGRYCDHDTGNREILRDYGVWNEPAKKEIKPGLDRLIEMMDPRQVGGTRLHFVRDSGVELDHKLESERRPICVEEEMPGYLWDKRRSGEQAGSPKDLPVDKDNHGIDGVRYAVHSFAGRSGIAVY